MGEPDAPRPLLGPPPQAGEGGSLTFPRAGGGLIKWGDAAPSVRFRKNQRAGMPYQRATAWSSEALPGPQVMSASSIAAHGRW